MDIDNNMLVYSEVIKRIKEIEKGYGVKIKVYSKGSIMHGSYKCDKNEIRINIGDLCNEDFMRNLTYSTKNNYPEVPIKNYTMLMITLMHELAHKEQFDTIYKSDITEDGLFMALDHVGNISMRRYYENPYNYVLMAHEIDAERKGIKNAYYYLHDVIGLEYKDAEKLVLEAVKSKMAYHYDDKGTKYNIKYWISSERLVNSLNEVMELFEKAFETAKTTPRNLNYKMLKGSILKKILYNDPEIFVDIANEYEGFKKAEKIAAVAFHVKPSLKKDYPILEGYDLSERHLFGREIDERPFILKKIFPKNREKDEEYER